MADDLDWALLELVVGEVHLSCGWSEWLIV